MSNQAQDLLDWIKKNDNTKRQLHQRIEHNVNKTTKLGYYHCWLDICPLEEEFIPEVMSALSRLGYNVTYESNQLHILWGKR